MTGFLLDTNVFNHLVDGKIKLEEIPTEYPIFITYIQKKELDKCDDIIRRQDLMTYLKILTDHEATVETFLAGIAEVGHTSVGNGKIYEEILKILNKKKKRKNDANVNDALLGEVAIKNSFVLITNDKDLKKAVASLGGHVRDLERNKELK